jgi:hypothetical protein
MAARRVILCLQRDAHIAALLPVLRWLRGAGVRLAARSPGLRRRNPGLESIARSLDLPLPTIDWQRRLRVEVSDLLLGTTDDLDALLRAQSESEARFVAVARLPLPATLLSAPAPRSLARVLEDHAHSAEGRVLTAGNPEALLALARRTRGLPFLLTGCPELSLPGASAPQGTLVVLHPGDLPLAGIPANEATLLQERMLERVLTPLSAAGLPVELLVPLGAPPPQDAASLRPLVERVGRLLSFPPGALTLSARASWSRLGTAAAVLTLCQRDLLSALVAGAERCWCIGFALEPDLPTPAGDPALDSVIRTPAALGEWIAAEGWYTPPDAAKRVSAALGRVTTRRTPELVAQAILSCAAES